MSGRGGHDERAVAIRAHADVLPSAGLPVRGSRAPAWTRRGLGLLFLLLLGAVLAEIAWRHARWHVELRDVRFADHPEKISAASAAVTVSGYLVATVQSDVDFFQLAHAETAHPQVEATLCDSGASLGAWFHPMPRERQAGPKPYSYAVLVPMRRRDADLGRRAEDVCLRFRAVNTMNPFSWVRSTPVVVPVRETLGKQLAAYAQGRGAVELTLDPACAPRLCEPDARGSDLRP